MIDARNKGKRFERRIADVWAQVLGGNPQRTSYVSKVLDDAGVDLTDTKPFNVQCKAHERSLNYHDILDAMPQDENYNIVVHKRNNCGCVVALRMRDFFELVQAARREGVL